MKPGDTEESVLIKQEAAKFGVVDLYDKNVEFLDWNETDYPFASQAELLYEIRQFFYKKMPRDKIPDEFLKEFDEFHVKRVMER